ncbi:MAG TPA: hypothetical protein PLM75_11195, partial [bacterium]|nr:hypothetical protein [bacterium]
YSANKLQTTSEFISDNTQAKKYEFGSSANTTENQYIDKFQSSQLKNQISQFIETYNTTIEKVEKSNVKDASEYFDKTIISKNLENLGISKEEDGRLKFDETKFDKGIKPNQTEIKEITNTLQDIEKLAQSTNQAIVNTKTEISEEFKNVKNQITELQSIFTTEQNEYIKNSLNALFNANSLQSMLAGLGIARNLNEIV